MLKDLEKKSFDFYDINTEGKPNKPSSIVKIFAMFFYTQKIIFSKVKFKHFLILMPLVLLLLSINHFVFNHKKEVLPPVVLETKYDILVKDIPQKEFDDILTYINLTREEEVKALTRAYWIFYFSKHNGHTDIDMPEVRSVISNQIKNVNDFYSSRLQELDTAYELIKKDKTELVKFTHDKGNPIQKIINWHSFSKNKQNLFLDDSENIITQAHKYIHKPDELKSFLKQHQEDIQQGYPLGKY